MKLIWSGAHRWINCVLCSGSSLLRTTPQLARHVRARPMAAQQYLYCMFTAVWAASMGFSAKWNKTPGVILLKKNWGWCCMISFVENSICETNHEFVVHGYLYLLMSGWVAWIGCKRPYLKTRISNIFLKIFYLCIFRQKEREGDREGEKHQCVVASHTPPTGNLACNPGMCPDWELNWWPFGSKAGAQSTEPHQPGWINNILKIVMRSHHQN